MKITLIAGARPNFMKIAPIIHAIQKAANNGANISYRLVHTGQHYDEKMSDTFFQELAIPAPDAHLGGGGGTQAEQTAAIMVAFEKELMANPTDLVLVVGDVTSTMACAIVAKKLNTKVAHVEAGIRSFDLTMPEEINRMVTDSITDYFFTTSVWAGNNLKNSGIADDKIFFVGNVMIDTLLKNESRFLKPSLWEELALSKGDYFVMTLHRPANVDEEQKFKALLHAIITGSNGKSLVFPVHPRTKNIIENVGINLDEIPNLHLTTPMGYLEFNYLVKNAMAVITDSGGITEETTVMGVPCMTLRDNTERPETCEVGTNELVGTNPDKVAPAMKKLFDGQWKVGAIPEKWDGKAAERIVEELLKL
ncbi:non-hydrolyzing UDP-N-acetylglucosamine 2-epimerase [Pedobacter sp. SL55]|uniref:non-hydrolyzing UDP-N-acetylglucosamine 2-epimerase n=1 Tax=Pedobacter sp. SL55 TaxID=2995161 RepID=UPI00226EB679|nr:UDP-N-acetylglucosamine 2-epimerase (non-hydrolyzing) [Pedobacter sp. SL55]WAC40207.1 UDP-N-acetylglucosamine 2-epimerase (non-hydrolyzing) [Pedobacter sp. SL55]